MAQQLAISSSTVRRVALEGNISAGKSTLIEKVMKSGWPISCFAEPVEEWQNVTGPAGDGPFNLLEAFYKDPLMWAFTFQSYAATTLRRIYNKPSEYPCRLYERSLGSSFNVFARQMLKQKLITDPHYNILKTWYDHDMESKRCDCYIYLRTDPEKVYNRMQTRGRPEEKDITLEYLTGLHDLHEDWLNSCQIPIIRLHGDDPADEVFRELEGKYHEAFE